MARKQFHINGEPRCERIYIRVSGKEKEVIASVAKARDATISRTFLDLFRDEYLAHIPDGCPFDHRRSTVFADPAPAGAGVGPGAGGAGGPGAGRGPGEVAR